MIYRNWVTFHQRTTLIGQPVLAMMLFHWWWLLLSVCLGLSYIYAQNAYPHGHPLSSGAVLARSDAILDPSTHAKAHSRASRGHTIVSTADGYIHLIEGTSAGRGQRPNKKWSLSTGGPMVSSFQSATAEMLSFAIVPTVDGSILIYTTEGMRRIPIKARTIADRTPFVANDGTMYTGSKKTRIMGVDVNTGRVVQEVSDEGGGGPSGHARYFKCALDKSSRVLYSCFLPLRKRTGKLNTCVCAASEEPQWNVTFSEVLPLTQMVGMDPPNADIARPPDPLVVTPDGDLVFSDAHSRTAFTIPLSAPATGAFSFAGVGKDDSFAAKGGPYTSYPLQVVYKAPKGQILGDSAHSAVVRSLQDNQLYAVVVSGQSSPLAGVDTSNQLWPMVRSDRKTTLPLVNTRSSSIPEPRSLLSWLNQYSSMPLTPVSLVEPADMQSPTPAATCENFADQNDKRCLIGVHELLLDLSPESMSNGMLIDQKPGYAAVDPSNPSNDHFPALPYRPGDENPMAVDRLPSDGFGLRELFRFARRDTAGQIEGIISWLWSALSQISVFILGVVLVLYLTGQRSASDSLHTWIARLRQRWSSLERNVIEEQTQLSLEEKQDRSASEGSEDTSQLLTASSTEEAPQTVGSIAVTSIILGYGSHGTVVFRGSLHNRPVAVKRMLKQFHRAADREISLLIQSDGHPNVVRYYLKEEKSEFVYLALQLCKMSLKDFVSRLVRELSKKKLRKSLPKLSHHATLTSVLGNMASHAKLEPSEVRAPFQARSALLQIAEGVAHLHSLRIVHRDLKPHNILLAATSEDANNETEAESKVDVVKIEQLGTFTLKISDMGLGKQLDKESSSFASMSVQGGAGGGPDSTSVGSASTSVSGVVHPMGTIGWQAPELMAIRKAHLIHHDEAAAQADTSAPASADEETDIHIPHRRTQTVDIFSLGCVFHYVIVPGEHPFGDWYDREANIMHNRPNLSSLEHLDDAHDLISKMIHADPRCRPTAAQVCRHPFFWHEDRRLSFLVEFSDRLENEDPTSPLVLAVEANALQIVGRSWESKLHAALFEDMAKYRKYDTSSVRDCLRVIRNKRHHFHELPTHVKELMSPLPGGFMRYFDSRFPKLFMHCVRVASRHVALERDFAPYCFAIAPLYDDNFANRNHANERNPQAPSANTPHDASVETKETEENKGEVEGSEQHNESGATTAIPLPPPTFSDVVSANLVIWSGSVLSEGQNCRY